MKLNSELNEVKYIKNGRITSEIDKIKDLGEVIYTGKVYKIYNNGTYFIITDIKDKILFYQKYKKHNVSNSFKAYDEKVFKVRMVYQLSTRENISNGEHKKLFNKLVHSLLFMGYVLQDDIQHNLFSRRSIETLYDNGQLIIYYGPRDNVKRLPPQDFDNVFDNSIGTNLYYVNKDITTNNILENVIDYDYVPIMWVGDDLFDDIAVYIEVAEAAENINEIVIKDLPMKSLKDKLPNIKDMENVYRGNKYNLYKSKNDIGMDKNNYFIITDRNNDILFYQKYIIFTQMGSRRVKYYQLLSRENISGDKRLFERLIYSLLFLGYPLKDDIQHNLLSLKGIISLFWSDKIRILYNLPNSDKLIVVEEFDELQEILKIDDRGVGICYQNSQLTNRDILESITVHDYQSMWVGLDLFDDVDDYID